MATTKGKSNGKAAALKVAALQRAAATVAEIQNLMPSLEGRMRFLSKAGIQYQGLRDIYTTAGYAPRGKVDYQHYWGLYCRDAIAGRIIDMPAKTTWRTPPEILEEDQPDGTDFTTAWEAVSDRLKVWRYFERVDRLAGIGRYAVILLGVRGVDDIGLQRPLGRVTADALIYLGVYDEVSATISTWVTDTGDPRFGLPELYQIQLSNGVNGFPKASVLVHASRIIHVAEDLLQDEVFGRPRLERSLNRLFDLDKITASVGESFWQAAARILQAKISPDATITDAQLDDLDDKLTEMLHDLRRQFSGQGTELSWLPVTVETPKEVADLYFALISAATGIPRRVLFGNEVGELASSTDQATYFGMINERQEHFAEPQILRAFVDRLVGAGALPAPGKDGYQVEWPSLFELTELEQADANLKRAQAAAALTPIGGDPLTLVEIDDHSNIWLVPREPSPMLTGPLDSMGQPISPMPAPAAPPAQPKAPPGTPNAQPPAEPTPVPASA